MEMESLLSQKDMVIDAVDDNDNPMGTITRDEVFRRRTNFRVAHILVFNSRRELLIQRLARSRIRHPGCWGSSVAAYIFAGESYQAAAERRFVEELGTDGVPISYVGKTMMEDEGCSKFIGVFSTVHDGPFNYDRDHIEELEFLPRNVIHELHAAEARPFTPTFFRVLTFYESRM
jgi:isopentenyldiphosphate isomerase